MFSFWSSAAVLWLCPMRSFPALPAGEVLHAWPRPLPRPSQSLPRPECSQPGRISWPSWPAVVTGTQVARLCMSRQMHSRHEGKKRQAQCVSSMVALEPSVSLRTEDPLPVIHSRWPCSADGDVKHFKSYRAAMKAHWRFAMMTALTHKDAGPMGPTPMVVKMCLSTSNWESHHISKDFATGRLVMLAMLSAPKKIVVNGAGTWHAWGQGVGSDSRSLFTVLRDP